MSEVTTEMAQEERASRPFEVTVNDRPVTLDEHRMTGNQIKAAAIRQGVPIKEDFVLSEVLPNGEQREVPNESPVEVHPREAFWAIPGDDNS